MNNMLTLILIPALILILISHTSGTAEASGFCEAQGITGRSGNAGSAGSCGGAHGSPDRTAGEKRSRRFPGRPGRDPLDKAKGGGGRTARSRRRGKTCKSGNKRKKREAGNLPDEAAGTADKKKRRKQEAEEEAAPGRNSGDGMIVITERADDVPFLIGMMMRTGLHEIIDRHVLRHPLQRDLSWGTTAVIWLSYILSEGDHRKVTMETYIKGMRHTLKNLTGCEIGEADFADDRLTNLLRYLNDTETWENIEKDLNRVTVEVYELPTEAVRCDPTTVSGYHEVTEDGIFQHGHSKDNPELPQIKMMTAAADPSGMPLATDIVRGETADDVLYVPLIKRIKSCLGKKGLLYVGDCKMCAEATRKYIVSDDIGGHYLCPLPRTGNTSGDMERWVNRGIEKDKEGSLEEVRDINDKGEEVLKAKGYVLKRRQGEIFAEDEEGGGGGGRWERVFVVKSPAHAGQMEKGLEKRLKNAEEKIRALTPQRGRGKKQITDETELKERLGEILKKQRVTGLLNCEYEKETERRVKYVGRGRGGAKREKEVIKRARYQITAVIRDEEEIKKEKETYGWRAYVTDLPEKRLSFGDAVRKYRNQYRIERVFRCLKSRLHIAPLYVKRDDQITGITRLLTLGVRMLTLTEFVVRRSLKNNNEKLGGLHPENKRKQTDIPTAERILKAFSGITLNIVKKGESVMHYLTPLTEVQKKILKSAGLDSSLYEDLEINKSPPQLTEQ